MPFGLGFFATAGVSAAGSFDLLETQVLTGSAASVTFSSLSSYAADYQHLQIRAVFRSTTTGGGDLEGVTFRVNGDTGNNYSSHTLLGAGGSVSSGASTSQNNMSGLLFTIKDAAVSGSFASSVIDILDPFVTTKNTTVRALTGSHSNATGAPQIRLASGLYINTASLTSIFLAPSTNSWLTGSRFSLYGIRGG